MKNLQGVSCRPYAYVLESRLLHSVCDFVVKRRQARRVVVESLLNLCPSFKYRNRQVRPKEGTVHLKEIFLSLHWVCTRASDWDLRIQDVRGIPNVLTMETCIRRARYRLQNGAETLQGLNLARTWERDPSRWSFTLTLPFALYLRLVTISTRPDLGCNWEWR